MHDSLYISLKDAAKDAIKKYPQKGNTGTRNLISVMKKAKKIIDRAFENEKKQAKKLNLLSPSYRWILDNYYLYDEKYHVLIKEIKKLKRLSGAYVLHEKFSGKILPCTFLRWCSFISETNCHISDTSISAFISALEHSDTNRPDFSDYYSFGVLFQAGVFVNLAYLYKNLTLSGDSPDITDGIEKMTAGLRLLSDYSYSRFFEKSRAEEYLRLDPSGDYPNMTEETKNIYRSRLVFLARKKGVAESDLAKGFLENARKAENSKEKHIGYYLYPSPSRIKGILYFCMLFTTVFLTGLLLFLVNPITIITLLPIYELIKQITDKVFSYFTVSYPLPRLEVKSLPDTKGVLVVITAILTKEGLDSYFVRLENMYNSSGMKNVYFALLADYPESENPKEHTDDAVLSEAAERICALRLKYGNSFFLFVRNRSFCERERKFMGYERKRGAINQLCAFLSGKPSDCFINTKSLPDISIRERIRYVLTLDSDTNLPTDAVKELAGIMLHPLNKPEIDKKKGVVTSGYGIIQPSVLTELSSSLQTPFSTLMNGSGGFEIYSFSGFELYQNVFGEGSFCGKGMFDKKAFMQCLEDDSFAFPENTVLSHDMPEGARLRTANVTDFHITDGFPKNTVSYLKRHHRWVRGDTQNLIFLRKYIKNRSGKLIKNNISWISKYKIFDNFRRAIVPVFAFRAIIVSLLVPENISALLLLFSLLYIVYGFISDFASSTANVGIGCAARKYFSKNAIPGVFQSFFRVLIEVSMLPSLAITAFDAIIRSLYRMLISKKKLLQWTTSFDSENSVYDGLLYYIRKNLACAIAGTVLYVFAFLPVQRLIGLMWFLFPVTAFLLGKKRKEKKILPTPAEKKLLYNYTLDMWKFFEDAATEKSQFLPVDNIQMWPDIRYSNKTSPTNIGLYLASTLAARDFEIINTETMYKKLSDTLSTIESLEKWHGHLYNWYSTDNNSILTPRIISSVDSGNFLACLICLKEGLREYVNEKTELLEIIKSVEHIIEKTDISKLYDKEKKLFYIDITVNADGKHENSANHFDMLMSEARTLSFIATAKSEVPVQHYKKLSRPYIKQSDRVGVASWTGTAFEYFMPALFMPVIKGSLMYEALRFAFYRQRTRTATTEHSKVFGISESGYHAFDDNMNFQYQAFGIPELGYKTDLDKDLVISPYSTFLMLSMNIKIPMANLEALKKSGAYGKYGFYEAFDFTETRCPEPMIVKSNMSHHVGMSMIASANAVFDNIFQKRFMRDAAMRSAGELLEEHIPVDVVVKKIKTYGKIPQRSARADNIS